MPDDFEHFFALLHLVNLGGDAGVGFDLRSEGFWGVCIDPKGESPGPTGNPYEVWRDANATR